MRARKTKKRRGAVVGLVVALALGGAGVVVLTRPSAADQLVLGATTRGSLTQTLSSTGTVTAVDQASASFPASATVTEVSAVVGDTVKAGQVLATIDDTALSDALDKAALDVAEAKEALAQAEDAEDEGDSTSSSSSASSMPSSSATSTPTASRSPSATVTPTASPTATPTRPATEDAVAAAKTGLDQAQTALDEAWTRFSEALSTATAACLATEPEPTPSPSPMPEPSASAPPEPSASPTPTATVTPTVEPTPEPTEPTEETSAEPTGESSVEAAESAGDDAGLTANPDVANTAYGRGTDACIAALEYLTDLEEGLGGARDAQARAVDALVAAATTPQPDADPGTSQTPDDQGDSSPTTGSGTAPSGDSSATVGSGSAPSGSTGQASGSGQEGPGGSQTVAQAEAALEVAQLAHANAALALAAATLKAPAAGVLTALPFTVGQAASTSDAATVRTGDALAVPLEVAVTDIAKIAVGQEVRLASETGGASSGAVGSIALVPTTSETGSTTYTVTVAVEEQEQGLRVGTTATAEVVVGDAHDAVLVPVSAVTLTGSDSGTVRVSKAGTVSTQEVTLGVRGATHIEVVEGLESGDQVVLSDPSQAIPSSTQSTRTSVRIGGGLSGSGLERGGFGGPPR